MTRRLLLVRSASAAAALVIVLVLAPGGVAAGMSASDVPDSVGGPPLPEVLPFGIGETATFSIGYGPITAGEATISVEDTLVYFGQRVLHVRTRARSNRFFDAFFKVRDQADSYIDADSLFSRYYAKRLREGGYERDVEIHFDHRTRRAYFPDGRENEIPVGVHDILSAFFRVRSMPLRVGEVYELPTHGDKRLYPLQVRVLRRESVGSVFGEVDCIVVQPVLGDEGLFKSSGDLFVWFTADARRIPIKMRATIPVGAIEARLTDYTPAIRPFVIPTGRERP